MIEVHKVQNKINILLLLSLNSEFTTAAVHHACYGLLKISDIDINTYIHSKPTYLKFIMMLLKSLSPHPPQGYKDEGGNSFDTKVHLIS